AAAAHPLEGTCFGDTAPEGGFVDAFGFAPEGNVSAGGVAFTLPNRTGLAPGTAVGLWLVGGIDTELPGGEVVEEAEWARFADAVVSDDGTTLVPDALLPELTWIGITVP
ncbi:MAG: hypothetical protein AAGH15_18055, partial [Myxococcota bacterium]